MPSISFCLGTVRMNAYAEHPDWDAVTRIVEDLEQQTFKDFELVVVDGVHAFRREKLQPVIAGAAFTIKHIPPLQNIWTRNKKVAISTYKNSATAIAEGELLVSLDDACRLPPMYAEVFWQAYKQGYCAAMTWPGRGDSRKPGKVYQPGIVYGFHSFPLTAALVLNGSCCAYDGSQGLEDVDWSTRLFKLDVPMVLLDIPGFDILPQTGHDPRAIDVQDSLSRCCNASWQTQRVWRQVARANDPRLWEGPQGREALERLVGPCRYLDKIPCDTCDSTEYRCKHHGGKCPYIDKGFVLERTELHEQFLKEPPVLDLKQMRKENGV